LRIIQVEVRGWALSAGAVCDAVLPTNGGRTADFIVARSYHQNAVSYERSGLSADGDEPVPEQ